MALKAEDIIADPVLLLSFLVPLAILYLGNFLLSTVVGKVMFDRGDCHRPRLQHCHAQSLHCFSHGPDGIWRR